MLSQQMIDEFSDVTEKEKNIMKLWNEHVMDLKYVVIEQTISILL